MFTDFFFTLFCLTVFFFCFTFSREIGMGERKNISCVDRKIGSTRAGVEKGEA